MSEVTQQTDAERLEFLLAEMTGVHEELLVLTREHREALRRADGGRLAACNLGQRQLVARIGRLDTVRRELIESMLPGTPAREVTLTALARRLTGPARERLETSAARLRELIGVIGDENRAVCDATRTLLGHMDGMVRQIAANLSRSGTYGRCGSVRADARIASGIDLSH